MESKEYRELEYKYIEDIKHHISEALKSYYDKDFVFKPSTDYEDSNMSFDLIFNWEFKISIRIRQNKYVNYDDMTIRYKSRNNGKCEFDKIKEGIIKSNIYFYAFENQSKTSLCKGIIIKIDAIKALINSKKFKTKCNPDGTELAYFTFEDLEEEKGIIYRF